MITRTGNQIYIMHICTVFKTVTVTLKLKTNKAMKENEELFNWFFDALALMLHKMERVYI